MHYIQKHILDELRKTDSARYTQLNQDEVESGHFRYHLAQLINDGYVEQLDRGVYALTLTGQSYIDKLSEHKVTLTPMPKVITYTLLTAGKTVLLQKKTKKPYLGLLNMVGGKLHQGELAEQAALREVYEKTGVRINDVSLRGVFEVMINSSEYLLTHVIAYVFITEVDAERFEAADVTAVQIKELASRRDLAPDFLPIFERLQTSEGVVTDKLVFDMVKP